MIYSTKVMGLEAKIHIIENEDEQLSDSIGRIIALMLELYSEGIMTRSLLIYMCAHLYTR